jgi:hypothetical protein|tara:strand:+ start:876 stop:1277 length:402 start_codon:yes stop_codon:yes gene_type:complete
MIDVRLATADDGETIKRLLEESGYWWATECDWSEPAPFWLVAEMGGAVIATLQTIYAKPVCRAEFLAVDPGIRKIDRAMAIKALSLQAWAGFNACGADFAAFMVNEGDTSWQRILERHGAFVIDSGPLMMRRL